MKLAEALVLRADHQKRLEQLKARLVRNAKVQEGERPAEDPKDLLEQVDDVASALEGLIRRINHTNAVTRIEGTQTIADLLARRDVLSLRRTIYADLAQAATVVQDRYSKSEVKFKSTVNVSETQKTADQIAKEYRELDTRLQAANWTTEVVE
jgi:hypothetical protein